MRRFGIAALALALGAVSGAVAQAAPPVGLPLAAPAAGGVKVEMVRCLCGHRYHYPRRALRAVPDYYVPVYPGPPVGFTLRKLLGAGYI